MPQFAVYRNENAATKKHIPYLLDVQSDLLSGLSTRIVVPLYLQQRGQPEAISRLQPVVEIEGRTCVMMTPEMAGVAAKLLRKSVASLAARRTEIIAALDLLFTGF